ncbi:MAG TPA: hypothetical protein VKJ65_05275, partial [Phycisphaerae bacterium]|nr:hypothetical protein [Phycisphaerae bacterium]
LAYAHSNKIFAMHLLPDYSPRAIRDELSAWNRMHALPVKGSIQPHENNPDPDRRLAIGYVSADFGQHVVAWNLLPLLKQHDHKQFSIFCYSNAAHKDSVTGQLQSCVDGWRDIAGVDDDRAAQMIRDDQIDILVDLAVHTPRNRLLIFARKPAPIAVTYLGYCGSTGLDTVDYRFSDPFLDPPETDLTLYSEQTVHLPRSYWCYRPGGPAPDPSPPPALSAGFVTFGCLNNFAKLSSAALGLWIPILQRVANSKLILHSNPGPHLNVLREALATAGITADRLEFVSKKPWPAYISTYNRIDIALDTVPYNGGITTCDALFMGVPVVSLSGQMAVGRAGRSILSNVGLPELIAQTPQQYVDIAAELAGDITRLSEMRPGLRNRMQTSPLM